MTNYEKVGIFMKTFGQEVKLDPSFSTDRINKLRLSLIKEEFEELSDDLFKQLSKLPKVKNPSRIGHSIHFYGRERNVFFEELNAATAAIMKDVAVKKLGLQDLMDAKFAKDGIH